MRWCSCLAGRVLCAQLRRQSAFAMALAIAGLQARLGLVPRARAVYPAAACLHARSSCLCVIVVCGCSFAVQQGAYSLHSCVTRARQRALAIAGVSTCSAQWLPPVQQHTSSPDAQGNLLPLQQRESELETCKSDVDTHSAEPSNEVHAFQEAWLN